MFMIDHKMTVLSENRGLRFNSDSVQLAAVFSPTRHDQ